MEELFKEIAEYHGFEMKELEVAKDHAHVFLGFPPRYWIAKVGGILKAVSARDVRKEYPKVKDELWGGELWEDAYFARTVGDEVTQDTQDMVARYIQFHEEREKRPEQLKLVGKAPPGRAGFFAGVGGLFSSSRIAH